MGSPACRGVASGSEAALNEARGTFLGSGQTTMRLVWFLPVRFRAVPCRPLRTCARKENPNRRARDRVGQEYSEIDELVCVGKKERVVESYNGVSV